MTARGAGCCKSRIRKTSSGACYRRMVGRVIIGALAAARSASLTPGNYVTVIGAQDGSSNQLRPVGR